jgi:hypothetical protein
MKNKLFLTLVSSVFLCLLLSSVSSAILMDMTKEELIANCDDIIIGRVKSIESKWNDERNFIYTYVSVEIQEQMKGESLGTVCTLQIQGGTIGDTSLWVEDMPVFVDGSNILLHIFMKDNGYPDVYGACTGLLIIENNNIVDYKMTIPQFKDLVESIKLNSKEK